MRRQCQQTLSQSPRALDGLWRSQPPLLMNLPLALMVDELAAVPGAMAGATGSLEAVAGVVDVTPESGVEKPVVPEE